MKLTAAAVTLATFAGAGAGASANASTSKASKSSSSEDKFEGVWSDCIERAIFQIGSATTQPTPISGNELVEITKVPGQPKYSAVFTTLLRCGLIFNTGAECSNVPIGGYTTIKYYLVAVESLSSKSKDTLNFIGNFVSYLDGNGDEVAAGSGLGDFEIGLMTCSAEPEHEGALVCDFRDASVFANGFLSGFPTATATSTLFIKDGDDFESECAELKLNF